MKKRITQIIIVLAIAAIGFTPLAYAGATNFDRLVLGSDNYGTDPNSTADISLQNDEAISNYIDGEIDLIGTTTLKLDGTQIQASDLSDTATIAQLDEAEVITGNWDNTANPWADNEVAPDLTIIGGGINNSIVGDVTPVAGTFTDFEATGTLTVTNDWADDQVANDLTMDGGTVDDSIIGGSTAAAATITDFEATGTLVVTNDWADDQVADDLTISGGTIDNSIVGGGTPAAGSFTDLGATGTLTVTNDWADDQVADDLTLDGGTVNDSVIGDITPEAGQFTTLDVHTSFSAPGTTITGRATTTDGVAGGTAKVIGGLLFQQVAASTAVSATDAEVFLDQDFTLIADTLKVGTSLNILIQGIVTADNSSDTLTVKLYVGGTAVWTSAAVDVAANDIWRCEASIVCRTDGGSGTMVAVNDYHLGVPGTATNFSSALVSTTVATTGTLLVRVSVQWSTTNAGNSCQSEIMRIFSH